MGTHVLKPVVAAPMAGGASTVRLVVAVGNAGGFGFLAGGYKTPQAMAGEIRAVRAQSASPFGVNIFVPPPLLGKDAASGRRAAVAAYANAIRQSVESAEAAVGQPREDDDSWSEKIEILTAERCPVVSFSFGVPPRWVVDALHGVGSVVIVTVTDALEAEAAVKAGADVLCVQGPGAGGHRSTHDPLRSPSNQGLVELIEELKPSGLPLLAAGGIATEAQVRALRGAGAAAVQLGTLFLPAPESGANQHHKVALTAPWARKTRVTRAFSGRPARGLENAFMRDFDHSAPAAYPELHHLTAPMRAQAAVDGDLDRLALWAGTGHRYARPRPAAEVVEQITGWMKD
ncbi:nitronate monooxygenase [Curtobacterium flaccumfaciens]|uniref:nitronate monooxygenase n=1 Tax=Curtobacterium flaccumfaciens TaxID=2035 RepID=UPI00112ADCEA|nr:nitronate monooxygenase [Curtobacterium flaccumfaciens]TPG05168.1 nitronate monooxygenase [Curtobacterium flaccumfaciens]